MSQTFDKPDVVNDNGNVGFAKDNDCLDALDSGFAGASLPTAVAGRRATVTGGATEPRSIYCGTTAAWVTLFPDTKAIYGGLASASAAAFITAAPTSAVAAAAGTELVRKTESDAKTHSAAILIGTVAASGNYYVAVTGQVQKIIDVLLVTDAAFSLHASNYWIFRVYNLTDAAALQSGAVGPPPTGQQLVASTYTPGGTAITADTAYSCALNQNQGDLATTLAAGKVIQLQITKVGSPANITNLIASVKYQLKT